jgi:hypothetical protein
MQPTSGNIKTNAKIPRIAPSRLSLLKRNQKTRSIAINDLSCGGIAPLSAPRAIIFSASKRPRRYGFNIGRYRSIDISP